MTTLMELIDQHTKRIMEGCKARARAAGLRFQDETLEYIVTNRDLLELSPKVMIPTLYDYWVHDVDVLKEKGMYELYPSNPYETVINTRPPISFYNDNNPDWLNVMIFYHVLGHIDFFQNNLYFRQTWDYDFTGQALSDKRLIARLRAEKGRWVDYVIEFTRGLDNLVSYFRELAQFNQPPTSSHTARLDFYFDVFLQSEKRVAISAYVKDLQHYNACLKQYGAELGEQTFFADVEKQYPEFATLFRKQLEEPRKPPFDLLQYVLEHSTMLNKDGNKWMKAVVEVVRNTSLFFQPQIRTKIMNEGWASYWHEMLFLQDDRINGHEVDFARVNAGVTAMPRVGLNPYALGMRLFDYLAELADKGKYSFDFRKIADAATRTQYDQQTGQGAEFMSRVRENFCDFTFINTFIDQDFVDRHRLFVVGKQLNPSRMVWEYYVKSRRAADYRQMVLDSLYHPPYITIDAAKSAQGELYLVHHFEGKPLVTEFIQNTMLGLEFLWGAPVRLETSEIVTVTRADGVPGGYYPPIETEPAETEITWQRVVYTMQKRKLAKKLA